MSNQEVVDWSLLTNTTTSLLQFPFKVCLEQIIDFYFLSAYKILK